MAAWVILRCGDGRACGNVVTTEGAVTVTGQRMRWCGGGTKTKGVAIVTRRVGRRMQMCGNVSTKDVMVVAGRVQW